MLQDRDGKYINIGGGIREEDDGILITGNAEFEESGEGTIVNYHGQRIESTAERPVMITGTASVVHAADWDNDGDHDLIVGDIKGNVYLVPNEGSATKMAFGPEIPLQVDDQDIRVPGGDAGPVVVDWDADDDLDLVVGCGDGSVVLFRNAGNRSKPVLEPAEELVAAGNIEYGPQARPEPVRGIRSKVCVTDYNDDGRMDLLVGDVATVGNPPSAIGEAEQLEQEQRKQELNELQTRYRELVEKLVGPERVKDESELPAVRKELETCQEQMAKIRARLPEEYSMHGWVWLFLASGDDSAATRQVDESRTPVARIAQLVALAVWRATR